MMIKHESPSQAVMAQLRSWLYLNLFYPFLAYLNQFHPRYHIQGPREVIGLNLNHLREMHLLVGPAQGTLLMKRNENDISLSCEM